MATNVLYNLKLRLWLLFHSTYLSDNCHQVSMHTESLGLRMDKKATLRTNQFSHSFSGNNVSYHIL